MWMLEKGAGEGDEEEKWGAGRELCLLQRKGLCCHGIFIPLWEMGTCDTPIKSAMARQDRQPDPAGRAATSSVSPGGGHSTAGAPATPQTSACRGWRRCHQPRTGLPRGKQVISQQQQPQQCHSPSTCHLPGRGDKGVLLDPSGHPQPAQGCGMWSPLSRTCCLRCLAPLAPGRQWWAGCAGLCQSHGSSSQPCLVPFGPSHGPWGVLPISTPLLCTQVTNVAPRKVEQRGV